MSPQRIIAIVVTTLYAVSITLGLIANQRQIDLEAAILTQIWLGLPWDAVLLILGVRSSWGPYLYWIALVLNGVTVYLFTAWLTALISRRLRRTPV